MDFNKLYSKMLKYEEPSSYSDRVPEMRASGMPFCPIGFILGAYDAMVEKSRVDSYLSDFYMSIGTVIHGVVQRWLPRANRRILFGNWYCFSCRTLHPYRLGPVKCCGGDAEYRELNILFPDAPMGGHTDGVLIEKSRKKRKRYGWVLELKSTSRYKCQSLKEPMYPHPLQSGIYVVAVNKTLERMSNVWEPKLECYLSDIEILGSIIKYIARDAPQMTSRDFVLEGSDEKLYKITCRYVNLVYKAVLHNDPDIIWSIRKPCEKHPIYYEDCAREEECGEEMNQKMFRKIFAKVSPVLRDEFLMKHARIFAGD